MSLHGYLTASALESAPGTAFGAPALVPMLDGVADDGWAAEPTVLGDAGDDAVPSVRVTRTDG